MQITSHQMQRAVFQIYLPSLLMSLGMGMIVPAVPLLGKTFGVSIGLAVQVVTAQVLGRALSLIPSGILHDRIGIRPGMILGAAIGVISAIATAFATGFWMILVAQFCWGFGLIMWNLGRELAAIDLVPVALRGRQISALYGIQSTGEVLGPAIGGIILDMMGFRSLFLIFAGIAGIVLAISATIKETTAVSFRPKSTVFRFSGLSQIEPAFRTTYLILLFVSFCAQHRMESIRSMLPIYVVNELGYRATDLGFLFFVIGLLTFLMIIPAGFLSDKLGRKWATAPPALLAGITFIAYPFVKGLSGLLFLSAMQGIITGMALGSMTTYTYDIVPHHARAQFQVMRRTFGEIGAFTAPLLGGVIANAFGAGMSFLWYAPLHLLSAFLLIVAARESLPSRRTKEG